MINLIDIYVDLSEKNQGMIPGFLINQRSWLGSSGASTDLDRINNGLKRAAGYVSG